MDSPQEVADSTDPLSVLTQDDIGEVADSTDPLSVLTQDDIGGFFSKLPLRNLMICEEGTSICSSMNTILNYLKVKAFS